MSRNMQRRVVAAALLILALALGSPAHAAGLPGWGHTSSLFDQVWHWLASVLPGTGPVPVAHPGTPGQGSWRQKSTLSTSPGIPTLKPTTDVSAGVDPNG